MKLLFLIICTSLAVAAQPEPTLSMDNAQAVRLETASSAEPSAVVEATLVARLQPGTPASAEAELAAPAAVIEPAVPVVPRGSGFIQQLPPVRERNVFMRNKMWTISAAAHLATTLSDGITSYYLIDVYHLGTESNGIINAFNGGNKNTFGAGGFAYKAIWFSAINVPAYFFLKKYGHGNRALEMVFTALNGESTAMFLHETVRNAHYLSVLPH